jgi:hypothetical protein
MIATWVTTQNWEKKIKIVVASNASIYHNRLWTCQINLFFGYVTEFCEYDPW